MNYFLALLLTSLVAVAHASDLAPLERKKVEYLIVAVESLQDAQFVRDGSTFEANRAGDFFRQNLSKAGDKVKTAEDFIRYCASVSSVSGTPYKIVFADGRVSTSDEYLRRKLAEFPRKR